MNRREFLATSSAATLSVLRGKLDQQDTHKFFEVEDDPEVKKLAAQFDAIENASSKTIGSDPEKFKGKEPLRGKVKFRKPKEGEPGPLVEISNRAAIATKEDCGPVEINIQWSYEEAKNVSYTDDLKVALRSSGRLKEQWSHEAEDGIVVSFDGLSGEVIVRISQEQSYAFRSPPFRAAKGGKLEFHQIRIVDDVAGIHVTVGGGKEFFIPANLLPERSSEKGKSRVIIYNREPVANEIHRATMHVDIKRKK